ncbi:MAG TPA: hypothetical protein VHY83_15010 [Solirubrobacteraceae bacterium]|jgi:hypothetical protein|nr:hypothetical protein [Solirubrobacteraceae bacterium]
MPERASGKEWSGVRAPDRDEGEIRRTRPAGVPLSRCAALACVLVASLYAGARGAEHPVWAAATPARVGVPSPCAIPALHLRCPDLIMSAPSQLRLDRTTIPGRVLLRAASSINNRGRGPLELRARRLGRHRWLVYQALYDQRGRPHLFRTASRLIFKFVPGDRYGYGSVGAASYWKVRHVAAFELWSVGARLVALKRVRTGPKLDYCLRDLFRTDPSALSPSEAVYPACSQDPAITTDTLGTSVGWSDVYPYDYPEQWIDVTGLRGRFAFVMRPDPDRLFVDSGRGNDLSETYLALPSGRVLGHRVAVGAP